MTGSLATDEMRSRVDAVYRAESRRVFATLVRLLGIEVRPIMELTP